MQYWLGVTDNDWFRFLREQQPDEVNFWHPSGKPETRGRGSDCSELRRLSLCDSLCETVKVSESESEVKVKLGT